jgi:polyphenol oxidase
MNLFYFPRRQRILAAMFLRRTAPNGVVFYVSSLLSERGVAHGFSTRLGGISAAPFDAMNLGNPNGCDLQDLTDNIEQNYKLMLDAIGASGVRLLRVHQVHGNAVVVAEGRAFDHAIKADAIVTSDPTQCASVRIADCVPVLLATDDGAVVAAVHAGWRGVIASVVPGAAKEMANINSAPLIAAIGPCISFDAFEVGDEVLAEFRRVFGDRAPVRSSPIPHKGYVDLRAAIAQQLKMLGVSSDRIDISDRCTVRDRAEFFSHRRDHGVTGRMAAMIAPRGQSLASR